VSSCTLIKKAIQVCVALCFFETGFLGTGSTRVYIAVNMGISSERASISKSSTILDNLKKWNTLALMLNKKYFEFCNLDNTRPQTKLVTNVDFTSYANPDFTEPQEEVLYYGAFGMMDNPQSLANCTQKIADRLRHYRNLVPIVFTQKDGFEVSEFKPPVINGTTGETQTISFFPVYITHKDFPEYKAMIFKGSGSYQNGEPVEIPYDCFASSDVLEQKINSLHIREIGDMWLDFYKGYNPIIPKNSEDIATHTKCHKSKMVFVGCVGIDKVFKQQDRDFGLYVGIELFLEIKPSKTHIQNTCSIQSYNFGSTFLLGIASKNKWSLYLLGGPKYSIKKIKFDTEDKKNHKNKIELDIGAGTTYEMSEKISLSFRYIYTLKSSLKIADKPKINISSSKFVVGFSYLF
jgi:hypothetical protein